MPVSAQSLIERSSLFRGLAHPIIERVARLATRRAYEAGAIVFMRGDKGDSLLVVLTGRVRISASRPGGKEVFLNIMEPGDTFGEIALLDGNPRTATATAVVRTELLLIERSRFLALLQTEPKLSTHLIQLLCRRVRWTAEQTEDSALLGVPARLAKRLLSLAHLHGRATPGGMKLTLSQADLAQFLSVSRQVVNQHMRTWTAQGWIAVGRGNITISDEPALQNFIRE